MPIIENRLNQPFALFLSTGKSVQFSAGGTATLSDKEVTLPEIQRMIARRELRIISEKKVEDTQKKEKDKKSKPIE